MLLGRGVCPALAPLPPLCAFENTIFGSVFVQSDVLNISELNSCHYLVKQRPSFFFVLFTINCLQKRELISRAEKKRGVNFCPQSHHYNGYWNIF